MAIATHVYSHVGVSGGDVQEQRDCLDKHAAEVAELQAALAAKAEEVDQNGQVRVPLTVLL